MCYSALNLPNSMVRVNIKFILLNYIAFVFADDYENDDKCK